jgi:glycosyltransferase involved in cell wall biosynthesis
LATRLHQYYGISKVLIIPTPVGFDFAGDEKVSKNHFPLDTKKFLVPSSFSSHKNLEILIQVAEIIEEQKLPFSIILTIDHNKKTDQYFKKIAVKGLRSIISIGSQKNEEMPAIYKQCNAMLLPTLLESFGLPYVEAMAYGLPIVTSKLDFARDVCNDAAYYFNPFDSRSIVSAMEQVFSNKEQTEKNILSGKRKIKELPCWDNVFKEFVKVLEVELIN